MIVPNPYGVFFTASREKYLCGRSVAFLACLLSISRGIFRIMAGLLLVAVMVLCAKSETVNAQDTATYSITFQGNWNTQSSPGGVPPDNIRYFTRVTGAVHNNEESYWKPGGLASRGLETLAETGSGSLFKSELRDAKKRRNVKKILELDFNRGAESVHKAKAEFDRNYPLITLACMLDPSPDWFTGVSSLSLLDGQGNWRTLHSVYLFPYDAGTEEGREYRLENPATDPQQPISSLRGKGKFSSSVPVARLAFELVNPQAAVSPDRAALVAIYEATGGDNWKDKDFWKASDEPVSEWYGVETNEDGRVTELLLGDNGLSGTVPDEIGELADLSELDLSGNPDLTGELPLGLMGLRIIRLDISGTGVCVPEDEAFSIWLDGLAPGFIGNENCGQDEIRGSGGGGCSVASGGGFAGGVLNFLPAVFMLMVVLGQRR